VHRDHVLEVYKVDIPVLGALPSSFILSNTSFLFWLNHECIIYILWDEYIIDFDIILLALLLSFMLTA